MLACGDSPPVHVAWPEPVPSFAFLIQAEGARILEIRGPLSSKQLPAKLELSEREGSTWYVLGLDEAELRAQLPRLPTPTELGSWKLELNEESCEGGRFLREADRHERRVSVLQLPRSLWRLDLDPAEWSKAEDAELRAPLSLRVPEDPELCLTDRADTHYRAFGAEEALLGSASEIGGLPIPTRGEPFHAQFDLSFIGLDWIDEDTALGITRNALFRFERGAPLDDGPRHFRAMAEEFSVAHPEARYFIGGGAVDPRTADSPEQRILLLMTAAGVTVETTATHHLVEVVLDEAGFGAPRILASVRSRLLSILFEPSGRALAVGYQGLVLVVDPDPEVPPRELRVGGGVAQLSEIQLTNDSARPHAVSLDTGSFYLGDVVTGQLELVSPSELLGSAISGFGQYVSAEATSIVATRFVGGLIAWQQDGSWGSPQFSLPSSLSLCASQPNECGLQQPASVSRAFLGRSTSEFLLAMEECEAVFLLDLDAGCGRGILPERAVRARPAGVDHFVRMAVRGQRVLVGGTNLRLVEFDLR